ncbi:hypothetical protein EDD21DRAFT_419278 [Dissophora ornata]|nr:hypothetical protein EDD21DRAFT_419278 [Dissophora ornata]
MILDAPSEQDASSERSEGSDSETELESATLINSNSPPPAEVPPRTKKAKKRERLQKARPLLQEQRFGRYERQLMNGYYCLLHAVDQRSIGISQKEKLGPFYKRILPYDASATDISLVMLGRLLDKEEMSVDNETLLGIVESDLDGKSSNRSLAIIRHDFEASGTPANILGMLRIHLDFPRVQGITPVTCVKTEIAANGTIVENVMVYINLSNMDDFFVVVEGIKESKEEMRDLKKLVRYIAAN